MTDDLDRDWMPDPTLDETFVEKVPEPEPPVTEQTIAPDVPNDEVPEENQ